VLENHNDTVDIALLDVYLPDTTADKFLRELTKFRPTIKLLLCSASVPNWIVEKTIDCGAKGFIKKSFSFSDNVQDVAHRAAFVDYWLKQLDEHRYIFTFLAPNMDWFSDFEHLRRTGYLPSGSDLCWQVDRRVGWEIFSEYGFRTRIGRTLEKTGSSVVCLDGELLQPVVERLEEVLRNEFGGFRNLEEKPLIQFLLGLLVHLKNRGGDSFPG